MRSFLLFCCALVCACTTLAAQITNSPTVSVTFSSVHPRQNLQVALGQNKIHLCGLTPGRRYIAILSDAFIGAESVLQLNMAVPAVETASVATWPKQRANERRFTAESDCADLWAMAESPVSATTLPLSLSVSCLDEPQQHDPTWKKKFQEKIADFSPLQVSSGTPASSLIKNTLIGGDCFDVSNITFYGNAKSRGTFSNGASSINISTGVVLSTGDVNMLPGPNDFDDSDGGYDDNNTDDPDLKKLINSNQFDLSKIEFDFVPTANTVKFEFVFGSEEYCEFVGSNYNDVFGFFISGPGITGTQNIGLIPGTGTAITINNINHSKNSTFYRNNSNGANCGNLPPLALNDIELDGFTKVFTATATVQPCQKYHIKLAIADIQDYRYASAVFLKANSFNAGGQVSAEAAYPAGMVEAMEDCRESFIKFSRGNGDVSQALPVSYAVTPQSTAIQGIDFEPLPTNVVIPAGQSEVLVPVKLFQDGLTEGQEKIVLSLNNSCSCTEQKVEILINDKPLLVATMSDQTICGGSSTTLSPSVTGGLLPLVYKWNTGDIGSSLVISASGTNTYTVTVTDGCGTTEVAFAQVKAQEVPTAAMSGGATLCNAGSTANLIVTLTGQAPWALEWKSATGAPTQQTFQSSPAILPVSAAGNYSLVSVATQGGCVGTVSGSATVSVVNLNLGLNATNPPCHGGNTGSIMTTPTGGGTPYAFAWSTGAKTQNIQGLSVGTYTVTLTENSGGCTLTQTAQITEPPALSATATVKNNINCYQPIGSAEVAALGGTPNYQFKWSTNALTPSVNLNAGGNYTVTVTDQNNCTATAAVNITSDLTPPKAQIKAPGQLDCNTPEITLDGSGSSTGLPYKLVWTGGNFICCDQTLFPKVSEAGQYNLLITNEQNGCTASTTTTVTENTNVPTDLQLATIPPNCDRATGDIEIIGVTGGSGPYLYDLDGSGNFAPLSKFKDLRPGFHEVIVQDVNGCEYTDTVVFQQVIKPELTLPQNVRVSFGESYKLTASLNIPLALVDTIIWSPAEGITLTKEMNVVTVSTFNNIRYTATVISKNGCEDQASVQFRVEEPHIWAPNVFSPINKDGENDSFYLFSSGSSVRQVVSLQVYDRWGTLIFLNQGGATDTERSGWDGTYRGKVLGPGVFIWYAEVELADGEHIQLKGDVAIAR